MCVCLIGVHTHNASKSVPMDGMSLTEVTMRDFLILCAYIKLHACVFKIVYVRVHLRPYVNNGAAHALRQQICSYGRHVPDREMHVYMCMFTNVYVCVYVCVHNQDAHALRQQICAPRRSAAYGGQHVCVCECARLHVCLCLYFQDCVRMCVCVRVCE
jgi:hypothetical protein